MTLSMHRASVPMFLRGLNVALALIDKAEAHAREAGIDPDSLAEARLAPDMMPFSSQIHRVTDASKLAVERLTGAASPRFDDTEKTLDELRQRLRTTIAYLEGVPPEAFEEAQDKTIKLSFGTFQPTFTGEDYLLGFALPNFYFHVTAAYAILRNQGVAVGKTDYLGPYG